MTRLIGGRVGPRMSIVVRAARAITAGGMKLVASVSRSAGRARWRSLELRRYSCARSSRLRGSATLVGIGTIMVETRLPNVPICSSVRTDTGIIATSGSRGSSLRGGNQSRHAGQLVAREQPVAHRGRAQGHDHVVDRDPELVLEPLDAIERERAEREPP